MVGISNILTGLPLFSSVPEGKCRDNISTRPRWLVSKSFFCSSLILPFHAIYSQLLTQSKNTPPSPPPIEVIEALHNLYSSGLLACTSSELFLERILRAFCISHWLGYHPVARIKHENGDMPASSSVRMVQGLACLDCAATDHY